jgi:diacylglycerol kinase family enzyme
VVVNTASGSLSNWTEREHLRKAFQDAEMPLRVAEVTREDEIVEAVTRDPVEVVVAAGGDGTVNAVAALLAGTDRILGVIPGGTLNHFAKDLGIPMDLAEAAQLLKARPVRTVDVGEVNGQVFVNNASLGMYPQIVREREKIQRHGFRKWTAFAAAVARTVARWPLMRVRVEAEGHAMRRLTPFVFVGNNRYKIEGLQLGSRDRLDRGELCLCVARRMSRLGLGRMAVHGLMGGLRDSGELDVLCTQEALVKTRRRVDVALDGQVVRMRAPLRFTIRPAALRVIAP